MSAATLTALIGALAALVTAIAGVITAWRGHQIVNTQVKPQAQANTDAVLRLAEDAGPVTVTAVKKIINGAGTSGSQPG